MVLLWHRDCLCFFPILLRRILNLSSQRNWIWVCLLVTGLVLRPMGHNYTNIWAFTPEVKGKETGGRSSLFPQQFNLKKERKP